MTGRITEQTRQDYLDAMGIQTWFPRTVLPNALPHRDFDFPETTPEPEEAPGLSAREAMLALGLPEHQEQPAPAPVAPTRPTLVVTPEKTEPPVRETTKKDKPAPATSQFRLVTLAPNDECLVIAEMPHSGLNQFSRFHTRLLNDILRAIQHSSHPELPVSEFVWPLGNMGLIGQMDQDDSSAADAVCAYLSNQFGLARRKLVLLFGPAAARFVIDPERSFEELRGVQPGMHAEQHFAVSHGLNELMKLPSLKADVWTDLKPLLTLQKSAAKTSASKHSTEKN
ncbi:hypothetical protein GZ77_13095 [Endozoicomonas montiporae]|uniref:Uracil-DNA glycosylase-like domain-containing protein n=2 Tax=Endozoicomonas montiporae TaxID=1027273 RepID=A0A081N4H5_9GAMM|nr:hypothetical protein [Endozoicomonas montiporae]AMO57796.1 hypothetical protein EZMO1_3854 [Endozoicomonas montiporae CL-33]KEQ13348.1 hypothetical protein GZ77_13095 [Endozoicomonas montiporae]